jgi:hypothetical protein
MGASAPQTSEARPARPRRRWLRFSLRTLLVGVTLLCVALGVWESAERQRRAVAAIRASRGWVKYDYLGSRPLRAFGEPPAPCWLGRLLGVDYVADVTVIALSAGDREVANVRVLTSLQSLDLSASKVTDAGMAHLSNLASLQVLGLDNTQVSDAGLAHLSALEGLTVLSLYNTQVSDAGLPHLYGLRNLKELNLGGTQVSDDGCRRLREALPNCYITMPAPPRRVILPGAFSSSRPPALRHGRSPLGIEAPPAILRLPQGASAHSAASWRILLAGR